jgi:hypothetical protein
MKDELKDENRFPSDSLGSSLPSVCVSEIPPTLVGKEGITHESLDSFEFQLLL